MKPWIIVFRKELKDLFRDRRTMVNILVLGALLGPVLAMGLMLLAVKMISDEAEKTIELPVQGAEYAPVLLDYLASSRISVVAALADPQAAVRAQEVDAVLVIDPAFPRQLRDGKPAQLTLLSDHSRSKTRIVRRRIETAIENYSANLGNLRLSLRGVDPSITQVMVLHDRDLSKKGSDAQLLAFLPYLLIIGIMQAAMVVAADLTAGERERQSLEPLMANPVAPEQFMIGKLATNVLISLAVLSLSLLGFAAGTRMIDLGDTGITFSLLSIPVLLLFLSPLAFFFAALMSFVGAFARTVKEAQTYLGLLVLAALTPSMIQMMLQSKVQDLELLLPIWSHNYLINEVLRGEPLSLAQWLLPSAGALLAGGLLAALAGRLYRKPDFIF
ncbi:MAG TPA: ABC transporter permease [Thiolapillus brandeum]|uniref:ABC transporter permease n=1 Tax=Thiolapillus brandeum TaxID=1076588 RepID=A0A831S0Y2_9GAMM|nr:ABC transporter permease [Thiolapillus brandeum]